MSPQNTQPKYRQIAEYLREGILNGTYPAGQPLPSEETLAKQFGVTRPTVRQGLTELRASGLVEVIMGRGTFARSPQTRPSHTRPRGIRRTPDGGYVEADGIRWANAEPLVATRTDAPLALADLLRIPPGEPMFTYDALQTADNGRLHQLHRTYVPFSVLIDTNYEEEAPPPPLSSTQRSPTWATNSTSRSTSAPGCHSRTRPKLSDSPKASRCSTSSA